MKILSVDDSVIIRRIIQNVAESEGYDFLEARNGQEALEIIENIPVELIILDWNMPILDGYSTLLEIRKNDKYKDIPIMVVTTESERINIIKAIQAGAQQYLTKPFTKEDLAKRLSYIPTLQKVLS